MANSAAAFGAPVHVVYQGVGRLQVLEQENTAFEADRYLDLGARHGAELLSRELSVRYPHDTSIEEVIRHLEGLRFDCSDRRRRIENRSCVYQYHENDQLSALIVVSIAAKAGSITNIRSRISFAARFY